MKFKLIINGLNSIDEMEIYSKNYRESIFNSFEPYNKFLHNALPENFLFAQKEKDIKELDGTHFKAEINESARILFIGSQVDYNIYLDYYITGYIKWYILSRDYDIIILGSNYEHKYDFTHWKNNILILNSKAIDNFNISKISINLDIDFLKLLNEDL